MTSSKLLASLTLPFKNVLLYHKKKLAFFLCAFLFFFMTLFPFSDLTYFSKEQINQIMKPLNGSVDYSNINLNLVPFGIQTSDFELSIKSFKKPLKIKNITLRPNIFSLLKFQPGGSLLLSGFFSGFANLNLSLNGKTEEKTQKFILSSDLKNISLADLIDFQNLAYKLTGNLNGNFFIEGEDSFRVQPKGNFKFNIEKIVIPATIHIPSIGDIPLPKKVIWENSNLFGKIEKGKITVTRGTLGTKSSPINGRYKGFITCLFHKSGQNISQACRNYEFRIELELNATFQRALATDLQSFINPQNVNIIKLPQGGAKYLFTIQGNLEQSFRSPRFFRLNSFE